MFSGLLSYVRGILSRRRVESEVEVELQFHLDHEIQAHVARGLAPAEARRAALRDLGGVSQTREAVRGIRRTWFDAAWNDARWAARGIVARGWRAVIVVLLLATTLAVNTTMFTVVDSLLLNPYPFLEVERLVSVRHAVRPEESLGRARSAELHRAWQQQTDLFAWTGGYLQKSGVFISSGAATERVPTVDVTVNMFKVLGVRPRWGREFTSGDLALQGAFTTILSEGYARLKFGRPEAALGQRLDATGGPMVVVGVMSSGFAFPSGAVKAWRLLDPAGALTANFGGAPLVARIAAPALTDDVTAAVARRAADVGSILGLSTYTATLEPAFRGRTTLEERRTMLFVLLGAALALLAVTSANVAGIELAHGIRRRPVRSLQLAVGAPRASLVRVAALEGVVLVGLAVTLGVVLARFLASLVVTGLPTYFGSTTSNPIDLDGRAVSYSAAAAVVTWLLASVLPAMLTMPSARSSTTYTPDAGAGRSRLGVRSRHTLIAFEVAVAVALVTIGLMYAGSYRALIRTEKGFDPRGLVVLRAELPRYYFRSNSDRQGFVDRLLETLRQTPGVAGVTRAEPPPSLGDSPWTTRLVIDGVATADEVRFSHKWVDADYFTVMRQPLRSGRHLVPSDSPQQVVIGESFARRFWVDGDAVGHTIRAPENGPGFLPLTVVGVVGDVRGEPTRMPSPSDTRIYAYAQWPRAAADSAQSGPISSIDDGAMHDVLTVTARLETLALLPTVRGIVQKFAPGIAVTAESTEDIYADQNSDVHLATVVVSGFAVVTVVLAVGGLYAAMAFLVTLRTREIGIRMALGADRTRIGRLVIGTSTTVAVSGALLGVAAAFLTSRAIASQFYGVSPTDPLTYLVVTVAVLAVSLVATWQPALQAARTDPAVTLREE